MHEKEEPEDSCDGCDAIFCPLNAAEDFKPNILAFHDFETDYDEEGSPYQIRFNLYDLAMPLEMGNEEYCTNVYKKESDHLDEFCEIMKDDYGFSLGSWNVSFKDDNRDQVENIEFIFTF